MTARFGKKKFDFRIQIETDDVVYSGRLTEESCRRYILDVHTATNRQNWAMCELVIPVLVNVSEYAMTPFDLRKPSRPGLVGDIEYTI